MTEWGKKLCPQKLKRSYRGNFVHLVSFVFLFCFCCIYLFRPINDFRPRLSADESVAFSSFRKLTEGEVRFHVMASSKKYCALGGMPPPLVDDCLDLLLPVITHLVNSSLTVGYFPSAWKEALITPLLKKAVLEPLFSNLRPISLRFFCFKLTERAVYGQTCDYLTAYELLPELQSAYRKRYSTETALLNVQNDILLSMDRQLIITFFLVALKQRLASQGGRWLDSTLTSRTGHSVLHSVMGFLAPSS